MPKAPKIPYIGYSAATLDQQPPLKAGDLVPCPRCRDQQHEVRADESGKVLWYKCGDKSFLAGIAGRSVVNVRADIAGKL